MFDGAFTASGCRRRPSPHRLGVHVSLGPTTDQSSATAPKTRRSTLSLLRDTGASPSELRAALSPRYERDHSLAVEDVTIEGIPALLRHGVIGRRRPPDWTSAPHALTGRKPPVENRTPACAPLLPVADDAFALTFGRGHLLLGRSGISPGFGFDFAPRAAQPDTVRQVTHNLMDARGRTDRSSATLGHIRAFPIDHIREPLDDVPAGRRLEALTAGYMQLHRDEEGADPVSAQVRAQQVEHGGDPARRDPLLPPRGALVRDRGPVPGGHADGGRRPAHRTGRRAPSSSGTYGRSIRGIPSGGTSPRGRSSTPSRSRAASPCPRGTCSPSPRYPCRKRFARCARTASTWRWSTFRPSARAPEASPTVSPTPERFLTLRRFRLPRHPDRPSRGRTASRAARPLPPVMT